MNVEATRIVQCLPSAALENVSVGLRVFPAFLATKFTPRQVMISSQLHEALSFQPPRKVSIVTAVVVEASAPKVYPRVTLASTKESPATSSQTPQPKQPL